MPAPPFSNLIAGRQIVLTRGSAADARTDLMDWDGVKAGIIGQLMETGGSLIA